MVKPQTISRMPATRPVTIMCSASPCRALAGALSPNRMIAWIATGTATPSQTHAGQ